MAENISGTVIQVGESGGRGFFIEALGERYVITAAHCIGDLPPADRWSYIQERTRANWLGLIGGPRNVWAECLFADPVADIAVFGEPDGQALFDKWEAYLEFAEQAVPFALGKMRFRNKQHRLPDGTKFAGNRKASSNAQLFSLDGEWFPCRISTFGRSIFIEDAAQPIQGGMSGSPIVLPDGSAVGIVTNSDEAVSTTGNGPFLLSALPAWLARAATRKK